MTPSINFKYKERQLPPLTCPDNCQAWHTINQVAGYLQISRRQVYVLMTTGKLPYSESDFGRRVRHCDMDKALKTKDAS